ncbi:MAG: cytochrome-c peroxidase [Crocinitomicaceae bacterium]|nr:cytochrome-c peroxidase [Crocinitomicaceae bacterium]
MKNNIYIGGILMISLFLFQCKQTSNTGFGKVEVISPDDNQISPKKVSLGKKLFFDNRLSVNNEVSCASCHLPELAFTDGKIVSEGVEGRKTERNSPSLLNAGFLPTVMFDAHLPNLEQQVIVPIQEHVEMDMNMVDLIEKLRLIDEYQSAAKEIFNREFDAYVLTRAISAFERTLISMNSPFDQYFYEGNETAINESQKRGWKLFSEKLYCTQCHPAPHFTTYQAINNGLYADYSADEGRFRIHHDSTDIGKFKVPSLRNIEITAPYMHDGSFKSLKQVIKHYQVGGNQHINKDNRIVPFDITEQQEIDLLNFLVSLTDTSYMTEYR